MRASQPASSLLRRTFRAPATPGCGAYCKIQVDAFHHQLEFIKAMGGTDMVVAEFGQSTHHHMGTGVMTRADVDRLMESTDPDLVHLLLDTGHLAFAGDDPPGDGAIDFVPQAQRAADQHRLHYVHISAPDRGAVHDSWIPWELFLEPILPRYDGPLLVETFNAIPVFLNSLHLTRRKFWIPGEDPPDSSAPEPTPLPAKRSPRSAPNWTR